MKKSTYVEVVIKVPKIKYETIINHNTEWDEWTLETIRNGILLPKGHGRLIDRDDVFSYSEDLYESIDLAPTILEADEGEQKYDA